MKRIALLAVAVALLLAWNASAFSDPGSRPHEPHPQPSPAILGTTLPSDFPIIINPYLGVPILGFGASESRGRPFEGRSFDRVPVIFMHGNNDTPFPTSCNPFGYIHNLAQFFLNNGYAPSQLWGLGYQGDQCDLISSPTNKSGIAHSTAAAVPLLRAFVHAVMRATGSRQVDIVAHSLGVTVAREWMFQDNAYQMVRSLVGSKGLTTGSSTARPIPPTIFSSRPMAALFQPARFATNTERKIRSFSRPSTRPENLQVRPGISCYATFSARRPRAVISFICRHRMVSSPRCLRRTAPGRRTISPTARFWPALLIRTSLDRGNSTRSWEPRISVS
jgi:pimeloyl-ACP methyl ester carboxylesterase